MFHILPIENLTRKSIFYPANGYFQKYFLNIISRTIGKFFQFEGGSDSLVLECSSSEEEPRPSKLSCSLTTSRCSLPPDRCLLSFGATTDEIFMIKKTKRSTSEYNACRHLMAPKVRFIFSGPLRTPIEDNDIYNIIVYYYTWMQQ